MAPSGTETTPELYPCLPPPRFPNPCSRASWADGLDLLPQLRFCCVMQGGGGGGGRREEGSNLILDPR